MAEKEKKVKPFTTVDFKHNGKSPFHAKDSVSTLHPVAAEKLRSKGYGEILKGTEKDRKNKSGEEQDATADPEGKNTAVSMN